MRDDKPIYSTRYQYDGSEIEDELTIKQAIALATTRCIAAEEGSKYCAQDIYRGDEYFLTISKGEYHAPIH